MAWWYREYAHEQATQERLVYRDEKEAAKAARRGLWADAKPVPPWEWRAAKPTRAPKAAQTVHVGGNPFPSASAQPQRLFALCLLRDMRSGLGLSADSQLNPESI